MKSSKAVPLIYNLFPRHFPTIDNWSEMIPHIAEMEFNAVFVNPFHETGFSGSLYSVKDYYRLNPLFLKANQDVTDFSPVSRFVRKCNDSHLDVIMDLVINHTAIDSPLTTIHPEWYKKDKNGKIANPFAIDPANPSNVTVWGDLATIDNEKSPDRVDLWHYWDTLIGFYQGMGISGFRCDAAYQVPAKLWKYLITNAKVRKPGSLFYAETLGCTPEQISALKGVGFDYLFNSSKWWNFDKAWVIEQHESNKKIAPSISFPESHDTERLASETPGTENYQKCRYAFASLFSEGLMMTMGYEYGAKNRMDVVKGMPQDFDKQKWDLTSWIKQVNIFKKKNAVLQEEGTWRLINDYHQPYLFMEKVSDDGNQSVFICVSKDNNKEISVQEWMLPKEIKECTRIVDIMAPVIKEEPAPGGFCLEPNDILLFLR